MLYTLAMTQQALSPRQLEFLIHATKKWNLAHGSVRSGKTVCTVWAFLHYLTQIDDSRVYIVGHTFDSAYRNVIRLILDSAELAIFRPFCNWSGKKLYYRDKQITVLGAKDEGAIGSFQGDTYTAVYLDEATLYPDCILDMIDTRLSRQCSRGYASMNPTYPSHKLKQWIDKASDGSSDYYALHFTLNDNPFVDAGYKRRIRESASGVFYKRNYLGQWCIAEGAIFDFFDRSVHVVPRPPRAAEYWIAGVDFGISSTFACVIIGVSTGQYTQMGKCLWVEQEYYWDAKAKSRQKTVSEFVDDLTAFFGPYSLKSVYVDPSAAALKVEMRKRGMACVDANNNVIDGIQLMTSEMCKGNLYICSCCSNTIREIEGYVWDDKKAKMGEDAPVKKADHAVDAIRYCLATHKVATYDPYKHNPVSYMQTRFGV